MHVTDLVVGLGTWNGKMGEERGDVREFGELSITRIPHFDGIVVGIYDVFQVRSQGCAVDGRSCSRQAHAFRDVKDDACEAIFVQVDFLVVGHLTDGTVFFLLVFV